MVFIGLLLLFLGLEFFYLRLAYKFRIIDKPNERSSHVKTTVRGGGVIFPVSWLVFSACHGFIYPWFTLALLLISVISFIDDLGGLPAVLRFAAHLLSFSLLFYEFDLFTMLPLWAILTSYVFCIGIVNAVNFMDGINGITGLYMLSFFGTLLFFWNSPFPSSPLDFSADNPFIYIVAAILAFGFFNFRKKARCFAGDVGSVSIGFMMIFFLCQLIFGLTDIAFRPPSVQFDWLQIFQPSYIMFLAVYGVDSVLTIIHRLILKENIFKAHRKHLYQYLSNELGWPHLAVASLYAGLQFAINYRLVTEGFDLVQAIGCLIGLTIIYVVAKYAIIHKKTDVKKEWVK
jgi:UDP-GlcNAc:undecaprenyl-phosphate GlcNAc-1-phosphate transferase